MYKIIILILLSCFLLTACKVENLDDVIEIPKTDFSSYNYVLATEDVSNVDITTFFAFNLNEISKEQKYDLIDEKNLFTNSNPSISSGHASLKQYFFAMAKDKNGYSSSPGLYRMALNTNNRMYVNDNLSISKNNLFPARQLCIVNEHLGYFYDEGKEPYKIKIFDPIAMTLKGMIDLKPAITAFRDDINWVDKSGNNLVRTGSLVIAHKDGKLYISIVFLQTASFNLIADNENNFYLAVIDMATNQVEKIITYEGAKTVGFFVSENRSVDLDEEHNDLYFCSWGWNQFGKGNPSQIFRIKSRETEFDTDWKINIETLFGIGRIAQSMITYNGKIYLHISEQPYSFEDSDNPGDITMAYYEFDPAQPTEPKRLDIPTSNTSSRMNVFSIVDDKLFIAVPNIKDGKFNGLYSINKFGEVNKELTIANKYRPTRLYKLEP